MSYPVTDTVALAPLTVAAGSYTADLSAISSRWANDDYVWAFVVCSATSGTLSTATSGWTEAVELDVTSGQRMAVYYAKVASGTVATPTFDLSTGTGLWQCFVGVERDAPTASPIDATATAEANATSVASGTMTPGANDCRVLYCMASRLSGSTSYLRMRDADGVIGEALQAADNGTIFMGAAVGSVAQGTAAATAKTVYASQSSRLGVITIAWKNKTGGKRAPHAVSGLSRIAWGGGIGATHDGSLTPATSSWGAPTTARTIAGIAVSATAGTRTTSTSGATDWDTFDNISTSLATEGWQGNKLTFAADVDCTAGLFTMEFFTALLGSVIGDKGAILVFEDSAGTNWAAFQLSQKLGWLPNRLYTAVIDLVNATPLDSGGALNMANVRAITPLLHRSGAGSGGRSIAFRHMALLGETTLVGGNSDIPLDINFLRKVLHGWSYQGLCGGEAPAVTIKSDVTIGDAGTTQTYYDATGTLHAFPEAYDVNAQRAINVGANRLDLTIKAGSADTINLTATSISATQQQNLTFHASTDAGAAYSTGGASVIGMLPTWQNVTPANNVTHSGCGIVTFHGCTATNVTVTNGTADAAALVADGFDDTGGTYVGNSTCVYGLRIADGGGDQSINLDGTSFSGFTKDIDITDSNAGHAITIVLAAGTSTPTYQTAGAVVVLDVPDVTLSATVLADTRAVLYNRTTATELSNTFVIGTSWTYAIQPGDASNGDVIDLFAFKEGYAESQATIIYASADASFAVDQSIEPIIQAFRTEDSITDYTTITEFAPDFTGHVYVEADDGDGVSKISRLCIWLNGMLTTSGGATYYRGALTLLSTAAVRVNVDSVDLLIENVSATYGLRFSDNASRRLYRSDGSSLIAPASQPGSVEIDYGVVPDTLETGVSGLTGAESSALTTVAATVAANLDATISSRATPADVPSANDVAQEVVAGITF